VAKLTHQVSVDQARRVVSKRFVQRDRHEPEREWRALLLLAHHAPGLAPEPVRADLSASVPVIEMTLLPGEPLGAKPMSAEQQSALIAALWRLWESVPVGEVRPQPGESTNEAQLVAAVRAQLAAGHDLGRDPVVKSAIADGCKWFASSVPKLADSARLPPVFGQGDSNLTNFLWDGQRVRLVDFEDSGRSDRAFELAALVEHLSVWHDCGLDADRLIARFGLSVQETARLVMVRRLAALAWLFFLRPGGAASRRNPPGTLRQQAERLLGLL
jgi:hypothetical protein